MATEQISKFQPNRTVSLRGFDRRGAAAALHSATENGFKVSGVFRDQADFAVAMLYDADDYYEHPLMRYLPDFDFSGMVLEFDLHYSDGLQPIDSPKYPWIDWAYLDVIRPDRTTANVRLWDHASLAGGTYTPASGTFHLEAENVTDTDRITLWFQNLAFDYRATDPWDPGVRAQYDSLAARAAEQSYAFSTIVTSVQAERTAAIAKDAEQQGQIADQAALRGPLVALDAQQQGQIADLIAQREPLLALDAQQQGQIAQLWSARYPLLAAETSLLQQIQTAQANQQPTEELEAQLQSVRSAIYANGTAINNLQAASTTTVTQIYVFNAQIADLQAQNTTTVNQIYSCNAQIASLQALNTDTVSFIYEMNALIPELQGQRDRLQADLEALTGATNIWKLPAVLTQIGETQALVSGWLNSVTDLQSRLETRTDIFGGALNSHIAAIGAALTTVGDAVPQIVEMALLLGEPLREVAKNLARQCNRLNWVDQAPSTALIAAASGTAVTFEAARYGLVDVAGAVVTLVSGVRFVGLRPGDRFILRDQSTGETTERVVQTVDSPTTVTLTSSAGALTGYGYLAPRGGSDGNMIRMYATASEGLRTAEEHVQFSGGSSDATWRVGLDFSALGIDQMRQAWVTFAARLTNSGTFEDAEWEATFSNMAITADPNGRKWHKYPGKGTVRVAARDAWIQRSGIWELKDGFYHQGFALVSNTTGSSLTINYSCQYPHDLCLGTALHVDRGIASISIDGGAPFDFDAFLGTFTEAGLPAEPPLVTRRKITTSQLAAGEHTVTITVTDRKHVAVAEWDADSGGYDFVFDYLEAVANAGDLEAPTLTYPNVMPATDYDTDHTYKIPPARLLWNLYSLGFRGQLNHYAGVFWWNQRRRVLGPGETAFHTATVTFGGSWGEGESIFLYFDEDRTEGAKLGKTTFPTDSPTSIARHFAAYINETFVGIRASASGPALTITTRSPWFSFVLDYQTRNANDDGPSVAGTVSISGDLDAGDDGIWQIDPDVKPVLNRAARDWHADFYSEIAARGNTCATSLSMELVNAPDNPADGKVWAARFHDDVPVTTATGFSSLKSTHCAFMGDILPYHKDAFRELAQAQADAGLAPWIQFGEFLWWFFDWHDTNPAAGMAFYDAKTRADAQAALGRPLVWFSGRNADPSVNGYADADWLRSRIKSHVDAIRSYVSAAVPGTKYEFLYAYDVNYPVENGHRIGGPVNNHVNFPVEYRTKAGSGLDRLKMESLSFGSQERNIDKQKVSITFPWTEPNSWPKADTAYLMPIYNGGCPWRRELLHAEDIQSPLLNMWAWDHIVLLSWPLPLPQNERGAQFF